VAAAATYRRELELRDTLREIDRRAFEQTIQSLNDRLPRWYEKPVVIALSVMVVTIWATLRAVTISI